MKRDFLLIILVLRISFGYVNTVSDEARDIDEDGIEDSLDN